ncbi:MAG: chromosome segregation and condensation protein ScpB [Edaphobacter sp.]|nr:chromosome segregation and condensation protein ScpB [Edaphobacter sp.]
MSLKAKIEAVIYASEEPVTLIQLTGLLGHEAQAELDHLDFAQHALALDQAASDQAASDQAAPDEDELNSEVLANVPESESQVEAEHAESLKRHLHDAATEEAHHAREVRLRTAAATAAMSSADSVEPFLAIFEGAPPTAEQGSDAPAAPQLEEKDEKKVAREAKEKERRLRDYFRTILDQLIADYATSDRGLEIREVAGGYRLATKPEYHDAVRGFVKSLKPPLKLSLQALETLAVVAYKQPVTAPEISEIRGVDSGGVLGSLMARKLITTAGRKQVIGRPILYKTTKDFLLRFGLKDINELPSIEEFEKMAGELAEQEEIPMEHHAPETPDEVERKKDETEPQADGDSGETGETVADEVILDGRVSGLPPNYDTDQIVEGEDSPALDAEVQSGQRRNSEEG